MALPDLLILLGIALVLAAVAVLAGPWWSVAGAGVTLVWTGYVGNVRMQRRPPQGRRDGEDG